MKLGNICETRDITSEFQPKRQSKMYQKLKRKIAGLRYIRDYFMSKLHSKFKIHKNFT